MSYFKRQYRSAELTSASGTVAIGPIDISELDNFVVTWKNLATAACIIQTDFATVGLGSAGVLDYVSANTAIIATPSALGASSIVMSSQVRNAYHWIRFTAHITACASLISTGSRLLVGIAGHRRL